MGRLLCGPVLMTKGVGVHQETICVHSSTYHDAATRGVNTPIFTSSSFEYLGRDEVVYPRHFNTPNQEAVVAKICSLEEAENGVLFSSGMAAMSSTGFGPCGRAPSQTPSPTPEPEPEPELELEPEPEPEPLAVAIVGVPDVAVAGESYELTAQSDEESLVYEWSVAGGTVLPPSTVATPPLSRSNQTA